MEAGQAGAAKAVIGTAINGGSLEESLKNNLKTAFIDTAAAQGAFAIGSNLEPASAANLLAHAIAGCAAGAARTDGGCGAGALGAAMGNWLRASTTRQHQTLRLTPSNSLR